MRNKLKHVAATNLTLFFITLMSLLVFFMGLSNIVNTYNGTIVSMNYSVFSVKIFTQNETYTITNYAIIPIAAAFIYNIIIIIKSLMKQRNNKSV